MKSIILKNIKNIFKRTLSINSNRIVFQNKCNFSSNISQHNFRFPDQIVSDLKAFFNSSEYNENSDFVQLEEDITNNIHFFDAEQFTDLLTILGPMNRGSTTFWDLMERKIYDFDLNFVQSLDIYNSNVESDKHFFDLNWKLQRDLNSNNYGTSSQHEAYKLLTAKH